MASPIGQEYLNLLSPRRRRSPCPLDSNTIQTPSFKNLDTIETLIRPLSFSASPVWLGIPLSVVEDHYPVSAGRNIFSFIHERVSPSSFRTPSIHSHPDTEKKDCSFPPHHIPSDPNSVQNKRYQQMFCLLHFPCILRAKITPSLSAQIQGYTLTAYIKSSHEEYIDRYIDRTPNLHSLLKVYLSPLTARTTWRATPLRGPVSRLTRSATTYLQIPTTPPI